MPVNLQVLPTAGATRSALETLLDGSESVRIASAFVRQSGVDELRLLQRPVRRLQVIAGTDFGLTQVEALESLHTPPERECRLYYAPEDVAEGVFHPKLYLGTAGSDFIAVVGSSNLTGPALTRNIELNVALTGSLQDPLVRNLEGFFRRLWQSPGVLPLTREIADAYRVDQGARERLWRQVRHSPEFRRARELVRRTVLKHFAAGTGRKWLLVTSMNNYFKCLGRQRWGDENYGRINRMQPGDLLLFYIKGVHKLGAAAVATTAVYQSSEATWADREYPYRIDFEVIADPATPIDFKPFIPRLGFLARKDEKWGTALQTSALELPRADAQLLIEAIGAAEAAPELRLAVAESRAGYGAEMKRST
ncbi:MAG: phospholipase D-like domain-containing protein [bacterium]|nr:phospholipase D-like domain-containing protein [bacterium]